MIINEITPCYFVLYHRRPKEMQKNDTLKQQVTEEQKYLFLQTIKGWFNDWGATYFWLVLHLQILYV